MHHDCNGLLRRYATVLVYLSGCEGGETNFPAASDDPKAWAECATADDAIRRFASPEQAAAIGGVSGGETKGGDGVRVRPRMGDAVIFYNFDRQGHLDPRAVHSALPVTGRTGEKWACNFWLSITPEELMSSV